jgi:hypothetical protein
MRKAEKTKRRENSTYCFKHTNWVNISALILTVKEIQLGLV